MTPKQRFISAMNWRQPDDKAAMMELEFQIYEEYIGEALTLGFEYTRLSTKEKEAALYHNAELMILAAHKAGHDVIRDLGGYWESAPGVPAAIWLPEIGDRLAQVRILKKLAGDEFFILCVPGGLVGTIPDGNSVYDFVTRLYELPDEVHSAAEAALSRIIEVQSRFTEAGADGAVSPSDIAFKNGTFLSPAQLDEFFFPYLNRWVQAAKGAGLISIWHSDGNMNGVLDRAMESGVTAIQCVDPLADMNIVEIKKKTKGRLALIGNLDCAILHRGTKEEIGAQAKYILENCKKGGGFAFGGCNAIFHGISAENYQCMVDARNRHGSYL